MSTARQARGKRTAVVVAAWLKEHGWLYAKATVGAETGRDIHNIRGFSVEVKARSDFDPRTWWRQAAANAKPGEIPVCIVRCNGQGERAEDYLVFSRLEDHELNQVRNAFQFSTPEVSSVSDQLEQQRLTEAAEWSRWAREEGTAGG